LPHSRSRSAIVAAGLSLLIALVPLAQVLIPGSRTKEIADAILASATVIGLIWGGLFAYNAYLGQRDALKYQEVHDQQAAEARSQALAEVLLIEAEGLVSAISAIRDDPVPTRPTDVLVAPLINRALDSAELFSTRTLRGMATSIRDLAALRETLRVAFENLQVRTRPVLGTGLHLPQRFMLEPDDDIRNAAISALGSVRSLGESLEIDQRKPQPVVVLG
jgi:hypothetical protein